MRVEQLKPGCSLPGSISPAAFATLSLLVSSLCGADIDKSSDILHNWRMNDEIDGKILTILQQDARASNAEIARQLGMAPSAIFERIRKLEARGVIEGYETRLNPRALNAGLLAFVFVRDEGAYGTLETGAALAAIPEAQEVHNVAGEDCYLVKVRVADTEALAQLLREKFGAIPSIRSTRTTIVLDTLKETAQVNLTRQAPETADRDREERSHGER